MAQILVSPTRMELNRLKKRLAVARRGHKLLKDKRDGLMRQFLEIVRENKNLREKMESLMSDLFGKFLIARAVMKSEVIEEALMIEDEGMIIDVTTQNIMSVEVPVLKAQFERNGRLDSLPYGLASTTGELDGAIIALNEIIPIMLRLAQVEKSTILLAQEIERTRRRVNSLEYVLIPDYEQTIRSISMKLDENERGNLTRLMKVKDMIIKQTIEAAREGTVNNQYN